MRLLELTNDKVLKVVHLAAPVFTAFSFSFFLVFGLNNVEVAVWVLIVILILLHKACDIAQDSQLVLQCVNWPFVDNSFKGIGHNCDEHVHERDLNQEGGEEEYDVTNHHVRVIDIDVCLSLEFSKT